MKSLRLAIGLFAAMALFSTTAFAAPGPYAPGKADEHRKSFKHQQHDHRPPHRQHQQRRHSPPQSQWHWQQQRDRYQQHRPQHNQHRYPPHRDQLRREIHRNSHRLNRGPALPRHVHLVVGRPLPHGWSHRVPPGHVRHLPQYAGYEWHSAGRDLVLVAVTTGVVYSILDNILN
ncbi:MAG: anti-virulence regulator CigR family protein [Pseudomonas sp.]